MPDPTIKITWQELQDVWRLTLGAGGKDVHVVRTDDSSGLTAVIDGKTFTIDKHGVNPA